MRKMDPRASKIVRDTAYSYSRNHKLSNPDTHAKELPQTHAGSVVAASVSVNLYEPHLVDSVGCLLFFKWSLSFSCLVVPRKAVVPCWDTVGSCELQRRPLITFINVFDCQIGGWAPIGI